MKMIELSMSSGWTIGVNVSRHVGASNGSAQRYGKGIVP